MMILTLLFLLVFLIGHAWLTLLIMNRIVLTMQDGIGKNSATVAGLILSFAWLVFLFAQIDPLQLIPRQGAWPDRPWLAAAAGLNLLLALAAFLRVLLWHPLRHHRAWAKAYEPLGILPASVNGQNPFETIEPCPRPHPFKRFHGPVPLIGTTDLHIAHRRLFFPDLPPGFEGARIIHLTDFHFNQYVDPAYVQFVCRQARQLKAEKVFITGDFVEKARFMNESARLWTELGDPGHICIVRGNHDYSSDPHTLEAIIKEKGIQLLDDRWITWRRNNDEMIIAGIEAPYSDRRAGEALSQFPGSGFRILLSHTPDNAPLASRHGWQWVISGHTHGGQVRLPWIGPLVVPSRYGRRFVKGVYRIDNTILTVSSGIGCHAPIRMLNSPEIACYTLHRPEKSAISACNPAEPVK